MTSIVYDIIIILNQMVNMEWSWDGFREMVNISWDWKLMLLKGLHNLNTTLEFTWIKERNVKRGSIPYGIIWKISALERLT